MNLRVVMHRILLRKVFLVLVLLPLMSAVGQTKSASAEITVTKCWAYSDLVSPRAIGLDANRLFVGGEEARLHAVSIDGKLIWTSDLGGEIGSNILSNDNALLVVTTSQTDSSPKSGNLRSLSKETGITNWNVRLPDADRYFLGQQNGNTIVVAQSGVILSLESKTGAAKWKREIADGFVAEPVFSGGKVIVAARGKQIFSVMLDTGEISSMRKSLYAVTALGELPNGEIVAGDERGNLSTLNGSDKPVWRFKSGGEISRVFAFGSNILATSHDNFVYFLLASNGDVEWKRRLAGRIQQIANIDGRYAATMSLDDKAVILSDLATGKVAGQIVLNEGEVLTVQPVWANSKIVLVTNQGIYAYSLDGCAEKKEGGPDKPPGTATLK